ncbi:MAG: hypothetical protein PVSMB7_11020 [Chloroflexota bacterium]
MDGQAGYAMLGRYIPDGWESRTVLEDARPYLLAHLVHDLPVDGDIRIPLNS